MRTALETPRGTDPVSVVKVSTALASKLVSGSGFRAQELGLRVEGSGVGIGFKVHLGFRVSGFGFRVVGGAHADQLRRERVSTLNP